MQNETELTVVDTPRMEMQAPNPMSMLALALERSPDMDIAKLEKLMALAERWEANEARKAFVAAMAEFKANPPEIFKDKKVGFESKRTGSTTSYMHATIGNVVEKIVEGLARHGISHSWVPMQTGKIVKITCVLTHRLGHSTETSMEGPLDDSGNKNVLQQMSSTASYLERYTLLAATGLATKDQMDDDGKGTAEKPPVGTEAADPFIGQVPPGNVAWQELYPADWKAAQNPKNPAETLGDLAAAPGGEVALKALWWHNQQNVALCAWSATWITGCLRELDLDWPAVIDGIQGMPDSMEDAKPAQLLAVAKWLGPKMAAKAKLEAAA